jgi:hypothetical protein
MGSCEWGVAPLARPQTPFLWDGNCPNRVDAIALQYREHKKLLWIFGSVIYSLVPGMDYFCRE